MANLWSCMLWLVVATFLSPPWISDPFQTYVLILYFIPASLLSCQFFFKNTLCKPSGRIWICKENRSKASWEWASESPAPTVTYHQIRSPKTFSSAGPYTSYLVVNIYLSVCQKCMSCRIGDMLKIGETNSPSILCPLITIRKKSWPVSDWISVKGSPGTTLSYCWKRPPLHLVTLSVLCWCAAGCMSSWPQLCRILVQR